MLLSSSLLENSVYIMVRSSFAFGAGFPTTAAFSVVVISAPIERSAHGSMKIGML
jgi:hypothetical protein